MDCNLNDLKEEIKEETEEEKIDIVRSACKLRARRTEYKSVFFQTT